MPTIVPYTLEKFMLGSEMYAQWANVLNDHTLKYGSTSNNNIQPALLQTRVPDFSKRSKSTEGRRGSDAPKG